MMQKAMWFTIAEKLPSLNEVIRENRRNRFAGAKLKKQLEIQIGQYIAEAVRRGHLGAIQRPCVICFTWHEKTRRRDVDNIQSSQKFILDALQRRGILPNDSRRWVKQTSHVVVDDDTDGVEITIREVE